ETGEEIEPTEELEAIQQKVQHELELSDRVLQGDLLRFNVPNEDWSPVDMNDYFYDENQVDVDESLYEKWLGRPTLKTDEDIQQSSDSNDSEEINSIKKIKMSICKICRCSFFVKVLGLNLYYLLTFEYVESYLNLYFHHLQ